MMMITTVLGLFPCPLLLFHTLSSDVGLWPWWNSELALEFLRTVPLQVGQFPWELNAVAVLAKHLLEIAHMKSIHNPEVYALIFFALCVCSCAPRCCTHMFQCWQTFRTVMSPVAGLCQTSGLFCRLGVSSCGEYVTSVSGGECES